MLSDKLEIEQNEKTLFEGRIDVFPWRYYNSFPRPSDYEILVLDMYVSSADLCPGAFIGLRNEISALLEAGGAVVCLNFTTLKTYKEMSVDPRESKLLAKDIIWARGNYRFETNYDWLFLEQLLSRLNVAQTDAKPGKNFALLSKKKIYIDYFSGVREYHKTIENIEEKKGKDNCFLGYEFWLDSETTLDCEIIVSSKVTQKPIACEIKILNGKLVFLPQSEANKNTVIEQLYGIGASVYETNFYNSKTVVTAPEWLSKYKTKQELLIEKEIETHTSAIQQEKRKLLKFSMADILLYGTGDPLEDAVELTLREMGCQVEKLEKGSTVDFKVSFGRMKLVIEATGVEDKIYKDNNHFASILQYLPHKEEAEKIVFLVNTYRKSDAGERLGKEHFTKPVLDISKNNHFCLMTTLDLYYMWRDFLNGKPTEELLSMIYVSEGEFRYVSSKNELSQSK